MNKNLVVKSNDLIEARYDLNLNEQKIILYAVSKLDRNKERFNILELQSNEFMKLLGTTQFRYTEIKEMVSDLMKKQVSISTDRSNLLVNWVSSIEYITNSGIIELEFSEKLAPYLLQLKKKFTRYQLKNILNLKSKYSIRIYELMKQYETIGKRTFKLDELKKILFIENQYERIYDLERFVLKPAKEEINKFTDLCIEYNKVKTGRRITSIEFIIDTKDHDGKDYIEYLNQNYDIKDFQYKMGMKDEKLSTNQVIKIYEKAVEKLNGEDSITIFEYIRLNYLYAKSKKGTRNIYSYLLKCLEYDYEHAISQISTGYYIDK